MKSKNFKEMSDYMLCLNRKEEGALKELHERYQNLIYKYAHTFHKSIYESVPIEDIIQDFNTLFFVAIYKINLDKIKNKEEFKIIVFIPYYFQAYQKVLYKKYLYEINCYCNEDNDEEEFNFDQFYTYDKNYSLLYTLEKILTPLEYEIIYKHYFCKMKKISIAKEMNISINRFNNLMDKILNKLKINLLPEKELLYY